MKGRTGASTSFEASTVSFGAGESIDAIFTAPAYVPAAAISDGAGGFYNKYVLYDRAYERTNNRAATADPDVPGSGSLPYGGRQTEVRVYQTGTLSAQLLPNT